MKKNIGLINLDTIITTNWERNTANKLKKKQSRVLIKIL